MRYRLLAVAGWTVVGVALLAGAGDRGEIRARRVVIEDEDGRERIVLQESKGVPKISVLGSDGQPRIILAVTPGDSPLGFFTGNKETGSYVAISVDNRKLDTSPVLISRNGGNPQQVMTEPVH